MTHVKAEETPKESNPEKKEEEEAAAPLGNGGRTEKYIWTQTLEVYFLIIIEFRHVHLHGFKRQQKTD